MIKKKKKGKEEIGKKFLDKKGTYLVQASAVAAQLRLRATTARIGTLTAVNPVEAWRPDDDWMQTHICRLHIKKKISSNETGSLDSF